MGSRIRRWPSWPCAFPAAGEQTRWKKSAGRTSGKAYAGNELGRVFHGHVPKKRLQPVLQQLEAQRRISIFREKTGGRSRQVLCLCKKTSRGKEAKKEPSAKKKVTHHESFFAFFFFRMLRKGMPPASQGSVSEIWRQAAEPVYPLWAHADAVPPAGAGDPIYRRQIFTREGRIDSSFLIIEAVVRLRVNVSFQLFTLAELYLDTAKAALPRSRIVSSCPDISCGYLPILTQPSDTKLSSRLFLPGGCLF